MTIASEEALAIMRDVNNIRVDVDSLKQHKVLCDLQHETNDERNKRRDDAANNQAQSIVLLAKSVNDMNLILTRALDKVEAGEPVIRVGSKILATWDVNKFVWPVLIAVVAGIMTLAGAYHYFWG